MDFTDSFRDISDEKYQVKYYHGKMATSLPFSHVTQRDISFQVGPV